MTKPTDEKQLVDFEIQLSNSRGKVEIIAAKTRFGNNATRKCNFFGDYSAVRGSAYISPQDAGEDLFGGDDE
jgi:hypothetical protein